MFLSLDGVDGVGKSTQLRLLAEWLREAGRTVVTCRDPGSTALGEALRDLLLDRHEIPIHPRSEMLVYMAARAQMVEQVIRPALAEGSAVLSDRFLLANVVYQGYAGGLDVDSLWEVGRIATGGLQPELTLVLDMDTASAARRIEREPDRLEARGLEYMEQVRQGFRTEAQRRPQHVVLIDANRSVEAVQEDLRAALRHLVDTG